jgi:hypothetical protein
MICELLLRCISVFSCSHNKRGVAGAETETDASPPTRGLQGTGSTTLIQGRAPAIHRKTRATRPSREAALVDLDQTLAVPPPSSKIGNIPRAQCCESADVSYRT